MDRGDRLFEYWFSSQKKDLCKTPLFTQFSKSGSILLMIALLFRHSLPFTKGFICKAGQGFESDGGSNSGQSGCKAGTFEGF
jgi:hypothetical protein